MKKTFIALTLVLGILATGISQSLSVHIPGLKGKRTASLTAVSAESMTSPGTPGRRGAPPSQYYLVTRTPDQHSTDVEDAADRGRAFRKVLLVTRLADGSKVVREFDQAFISDYNVTLGQGSRETFRINYNNETVTSN